MGTKKITKEKIKEASKKAAKGLAIGAVGAAIGAIGTAIVSKNNLFEAGFKEGAMTIVSRNKGYKELGCDSMDEFEDYIDGLYNDYMSE